MGLSKDSMQFLDLASRGAFLGLSASEARTILDKIIGCIPYTGSHDELPKEEESTPEQEEEALIAKSQPLQSQDLAINRGPPISQNPKEEETQLLQFPFEIENDFFFNADYGNTLNSHSQNMPSNSNPFKKGSSRKLPKSTSSYTSNSYVGQQEKSKDGITSKAIEGETSHL
jgi:hypothetical protein